MAKELALEPRLAVPESGAPGQVWDAFVESAQFGIALTRRSPQANQCGIRRPRRLHVRGARSTHAC
jgi:hypothetical protein